MIHASERVAFVYMMGIFTFALAQAPRRQADGRSRAQTPEPALRMYVWSAYNALMMQAGR